MSDHGSMRPRDEDVDDNNIEKNVRDKKNAKKKTKQVVEESPPPVLTQEPVNSLDKLRSVTLICWTDP